MGVLSRIFRRKSKDPSLKGPKGVTLSREQALKATLVRNAAVVEERKDSGETVLSVPIAETRSFKIMAWFMRRASKQPIPKFRKIELDEMGTSVWDMADGTHTVIEVVRHLSKKYKIPRKEAEYSGTLFIKQLAEKHLVGLDLTHLIDPGGKDGPK